LGAVALTEQGRVIPLTTGLSLHAADLALQYGLSFVDAIIYATASQLDALLVTADDHFRALPEVVYFSKKGGGSS
jgi:predicted nucleic acid-binding protein